MASFNKIKKIIQEIASLARMYGIKNSYVVGGYPRALIRDDVKNDVHDIDFASAWPGEAVKLGTLAAAHLAGVLPEVYQRTGTIKFTYKGVDLEFQGTLGNLSDLELVMEELQKYGISVSPLTLNIYSRDFTINTLIQDLNNIGIYDITGFGLSDIKNGLIRTPINPVASIKSNPLIILRAIRFSLRYNYTIVDSLKKCMFMYKDLLLKKYSPERIKLEVLRMLRDDYDGTIQMIKKFGLEDILSNKLYNIFDILDKIDIHTYSGDLTLLV